MRPNSALDIRYRSVVVSFVTESGVTADGDGLVAVSEKLSLSKSKIERRVFVVSEYWSYASLPISAIPPKNPNFFFFINRLGRSSSTYVKNLN